MFHILRTPTCEKVYRPEKADSGERYSITAKLLSRKFICKEMICICIYVYIYIQGDSKVSIHRDYMVSACAVG
jgi:hypothetical protein